VLFQSLQHLIDMFQVLFLVLFEYQVVVHAHDDKEIVDSVLEYIVHQLLKRRRRISQPHRQHQVLELATLFVEGSLLILRARPDLMKPGLQIHF
jgi:hypothetical protein